MASALAFLLTLAGAALAVDSTYCKGVNTAPTYDPVSNTITCTWTVRLSTDPRALRPTPGIH